MSENHADLRTKLKRALVALREMRAKLESAEAGNRQPIAIVGMSCRFPGGVQNPDDYWRLLNTGRDAIREVPADRWDIDAWFDPDQDAPGKVASRNGGFLDQVDQFDAQFFGIAPREADYLDPQQRLLLEVTWESLEHAGIAPDSLRGSATGVFVGISSSEYAELLLAAGPASINYYVGSGNANSVAAGRIAYVLDLVGPALAIDTACSSSLVAVDLACQSLRSRRCQMALAGGVNVLLTPTVNINHSKARMLAPNGRCKTFDAAADGFVRSEGCGVVVLKRLEDALADRDNILAVIRGTATNQDGHTSGLTVPNGPSQEAVITRAHQDAGISAGDISYVEAHGTGTSLGDPIELNALSNVFAPGRTADRPLLVGSAKTNIGHAEAAAGIAGLIKVVLSLRHKTIPPHLHFHQPTPHFAWESSPLCVPRENTAWDSDTTSPRMAGVSSFGFGGTNAHVIVEEAASTTRLDSRLGSSFVQTPRLLPLSAQSSEARRQLAATYAAHLQNRPELGLADVCLTAGAGRSHFRHRAVMVVDSLEQAVERLRDVAENRTSNGVFQGLAGVVPPKIAFLFTGQGSQYAGMGRELYESEPVFRETMQQCQELLRPHLDIPLLEVLYPADNTRTPLNETAYTQPALFAIEYSLAELWKSWGIVPDVVLGHSVGEYTAACLAGVFDLEDGLRLIAGRGRLMQALPGGGAMAAVFTEHRRVVEAINRHAPEVAIAAINGPRNTVVSGRENHVEKLLRLLRDDGIESQPLRVSHAFHSPLIEPMIAQFAAIAARVEWSAPKLDLVSNLTGQLVGDGMIDAEYWCRHMRQAVRFAEGIATVHQLGCRLMIEIGPQPVLLGMGQQCVADDEVRWLASLRSGRPDRQQMLQSLAELYTRGAKVCWAGLHHEGRRIELPTYPFQRRRHWAEAASRLPRPSAGLGQERGTDAGSDNPLLGERVDCALHAQEVVFQSRLGRRTRSLADQHRVFGKSIMSAAGYLSMAHAAAKSVFQTEAFVIQDATFHEALVFEETEEKSVQLIINRNDGAWRVYSRRNPPVDPPQWTLHASGIAALLTQEQQTSERGGTHVESLSALRAKIITPLSRKEFYEAYSERGVEFGPLFQAVQRLWFSDSQALGQIRMSNELDWSQQLDDLHPALLDAAAQLVGAARGQLHAMPADDLRNCARSLWLQSGVEQYRSYRPPVGELWAHASIRPTDEEHILVADIRMFDATGAVVAEILGLRARSTSVDLWTDSSSSQAEYYALDWLVRPRTEQPVVERHDGSCTTPQGAAGVEPRKPPEESELHAWSMLPRQVAATLVPRFNTVLASPEIGAYGNLLGELESLSPLYIARALRRMGWSPRPHDRFDANELKLRLGVLPQYARLFHRLLAILADNGLLRHTDHQWEIIAEISDDDLGRRVTGLRQRWASSAELELLDRCGHRLADVLRGECQPLELIFPNGDMTTAARVYGDSPGVKAFSALFASAIVEALECLPEGRPLRILEIGAGTGGTTSFVLPSLPPDRTKYFFTDISRHFLPAASQKFARFPFVRYQVLDIERSPPEQDFKGPPFDMIIASNVLHATRNLRDTMRHIGQLLSPGGLLWLVENIVPSSWVELIWGLTDGWWRFDDDLRTSHPLLTGDDWRQLLQASGFRHVEVIAAEADRHGHLSRQAIIVAHHASVHHDPLPAVASAPGPSDRQPTGDSDNQPLVGGRLRSTDAPVWLVLDEPGGLGESLAASLASQGNDCVLVRKAGRFAQHSRDVFDVDPNRRGDFVQVIESVCRQGYHLRGVLQLWRHASAPIELLTPAEVGMLVHENCMGLVHLVQALASQPFETSPALWLVTRASQPIPSTHGGMRLDLSPLWSIGRVVALEHPNLWGGMLDLDAQPQPDEISALVNEVLYPDGEDQVALRGGDRLVPRLVRSDPPPVARLPIRSDASYLITGGCGAFGLAAAAWLVQHGARHLVLVGRSGAATGAICQAIASLESAGAKVLVISADVSDLDEMSSLFRQFNSTLPRLGGVIHAAGRPGYRPLVELDDETVRDVLRAKVTGTWVLHELTKALHLDFFVGCSSMVSVWGAKGQSHYGAANQFLDVVAHYRRGLGLPGLSVNWGPLTGGGMLAPGDVPELRRMGVSASPLNQAVATFAQLLGSDIAQTTFVDIDWPIFKGVYEARRKRPLFEQLGVSERTGGANAATFDGLDHARREADAIVERLRSVPPSECRELMSDHVQIVLASVLGLVERTDGQTGFFDMGMDSLTALELRSRLEKLLNISLPSTLAFDYTTVETLTDFLVREVTRPAESPAVPLPSPQPLREPISHTALEIEQLSDEEVEHLLMEKLDRLGRASVYQQPAPTLHNRIAQQTQ